MTIVGTVLKFASGLPFLLITWSRNHVALMWSHLIDVSYSTFCVFNERLVWLLIFRSLSDTRYTELAKKKPWIKVCPQHWIYYCNGNTNSLRRSVLEIKTDFYWFWTHFAPPCLAVFAVEIFFMWPKYQRSRSCVFLCCKTTRKHFPCSLQRLRKCQFEME